MERETSGWTFFATARLNYEPAINLNADGPSGLVLAYALTTTDQAAAALRSSVVSLRRFTGYLARDQEVLNGGGRAFGACCAVGFLSRYDPHCKCGSPAR